MLRPNRAMSIAEQTKISDLPELSRRSAMRKNVFNCSVQVALAAICLATMISSTTAASFTRGCAARDLQILMLIEERENTNAISAEKLGDALLMMMNARMVCYEGHVVDALAIYDSVAGSLRAWDLPSR
jgi:hypothetical protein